MEGTYAHKSNENFEQMLLSLASAEMATKLESAKPILVIAKTDNGVTITKPNQNKTFTIVFGQESAVEIGAYEFKVNVAPTASGFAGSACGAKNSGTISYEATAEGLTQTLTIKGNTAKRHYTKQ